MKQKLKRTILPNSEDLRNFWPAIFPLFTPVNLKQIQKTRQVRIELASRGFRTQGITQRAVSSYRNKHLKAHFFWYGTQKTHSTIDSENMPFECLHVGYEVIKSLCERKNAGKSSYGPLYLREF